MSNLSPDMESALTFAMKEAQSQCSPVLGTPHLFIGLTKLDGITAAALRAQGQDPKMVRGEIRAALGQGKAAPGTEPQLTERAHTTDPSPLVAQHRPCPFDLEPEKGKHTAREAQPVLRTGDERTCEFEVGGPQQAFGSGRSKRFCAHRTEAGDYSSDGQ